MKRWLYDSNAGWSWDGWTVESIHSKKVAAFKMLSRIWKEIKALEGLQGLRRKLLFNNIKLRRVFELRVGILTVKLNVQFDLKLEIR